MQCTIDICNLNTNPAHTESAQLQVDKQCVFHENTPINNAQLASFSSPPDWIKSSFLEHYVYNLASLILQIQANV